MVFPETGVSSCLVCFASLLDAVLNYACFDLARVTTYVGAWLVFGYGRLAGLRCFV